MDYTDVHYRQLARLISARTWLWTEMVVDKTLIHGTMTDKFVSFPPGQRPLVCQLGGSDPEELAAAARIVARRVGGARRGGARFPRAALIIARRPPGPPNS